MIVKKQLNFISLISLVSVLSIMASSLAFAAPKPLFEKGQETFRIVNSKGQTPIFRVLTGSLIKESLAVAANAKWKLNGSSSEPQTFVDLKIEKIFLTPAKNKKNDIELSLQISGHQLEVDTPIARDQLLAGKPIELKIPQKTEQLSAFKLISEGRMTLQYKPAEDELLLKNGFAKVQIESPLSDDESETIKLEARGLRQ